MQSFYSLTTVSLILASVLSSTAVNPKAITCEECQAAYGSLVTRLLTEPSLVEQMELLKTIGCPVQADPEACNELVDTWWAIMASILYPAFIDPLTLCTLGEICEQSLVKEWTCEECIEGVEFAAEFFQYEETIQAAVDLMAGDVFCGAPEATADCAEQMAEWIPVAIPILSAAIKDQEVEICQEEVGIC